MTSAGSKRKENGKRAARPEGVHRDTRARLAVDLPASLHRQLKAQAAEKGLSIRDYILRLLRRHGIG